MTSNTTPNDAVASVLSEYTTRQRENLLTLRALIFEVAERTEGVGTLEETLKWGQPSYLTPQTKSGTTIRIDRMASSQNDYALYVSCNTNLVEQWRTRYPHLSFGGNRSIQLSSSDIMPTEELKHCIAMALTYHSRKKRT